MNQKRLTNYLKIGILLFGLSFLFTNCERDFDNELIYPTKQSRYKIKVLDNEKLQTNNKIVEN